jgi:hypothetical protein
VGVRDSVVGLALSHCGWDWIPDLAFYLQLWLCLRDLTRFLRHVERTAWGILELPGVAAETGESLVLTLNCWR